MYACEGGHIEVVKFLIKKKYFNINEKNNFGETCLMLSCEKGKLKIVKILIQNNCNIHDKTDLGSNAFMYACKFGHVEIVKLLILKHCDIHAKNKNGENCFLFACENGNLEIVKILMENNIDLHVKTYKDKRNGWIVALFEQNWDILVYILEHEFMGKNISRGTPLFHKIKDRIVEIEKCQKSCFHVNEFWNENKIILQIILKFAYGLKNLQKTIERKRKPNRYY